MRINIGIIIASLTLTTEEFVHRGRPYVLLERLIIL